MSTAAAEILIRDYAKRLRLPTVGARAGSLATEAAQAGHGSLEFLAALLEEEVPRHRGTRRRDIRAHRKPKEARKPSPLTPKDLDLSSHQPASPPGLGWVTFS